MASMESSTPKSGDPQPEQSSTREGNSLLTEDAFCSERTQKLFEAIDELQSCGAKRDIDLPELVIVGDQSAGKSSLLQSLTDIPFPVAGRLCTRFPTRIVSRRTPGGSDVTRISIEATSNGPFNDPSADDRQLEYRKFEHSSSSFTAAEFLAVVEKVATHLMGITNGSSSELSDDTLYRAAEVQHFSSDVLKVEISGPTRSHFSILDLPGVFQSLTKDLTVQEKDGVRKLVSEHMQSKQSVIVCVASGTNDLANQVIFDMASLYDPKLERTVGVITKCDATQHVSQVLELARNEEKHLQHGWFVVRNRTPAEVEANVEAQERDKREDKFFASSPWNTLPHSRRGVQALKRFLTDLMCTHIQKGFPSMCQTIQARLISALSQLEALGEPRESIEKKRAYLSKVAQKFHDQASAALNGHYGAFKHEGMKLRKDIRDANDRFMQEIKRSGHLVPFSELPSIPDMTVEADGVPYGDPGPADVVGSQTHFRSQASETDGDRGELDGFSSSESEDVQTGKAPYSPQNRGLLTPDPSPYQRDRPSFQLSSRTTTPSRNKKTPQQGSRGPIPMQLLAHQPFTKSIAVMENSKEIYVWIRREIEASRGTELQGTLNPDVLQILFHKQAGKWRHIAEKHFRSITKRTVEVLYEILKEVAGLGTTQTKIWSRINAAAENHMEQKLGLLNERMNDLTSRHLQTNNSAYLENVAKARFRRFQLALYKYQQERISHKGSASSKMRLVVDLRDTSALFSELHMSNARNLENEIHDTLKAYYEIARDEFVEFVTQLIVEKFLDSPNGPVSMFSTTYVAELADSAIADLATEDEAVVRDREDKEATLARLRRAEEIALRYA